ncbi:MAG: AraC family transcriptional regulator [Alphaproteobacteria bacterium]|nr:AraC family transcriptional regulator [Alphaproteobacteria bacterium]
MTSTDANTQFFEALSKPFSGEELFDLVADTVYFLKDAEGCYVAVNQTLVERCGKARKSDLIGQRAEALFPEPLGERISAQDRAVVRDNRSIQAQLELHLYPGGNEDWCLTWKQPLAGADGSIIGLSGISRDLNSATSVQLELGQVSAALDHINDNLSALLRVEDLAALAGLSAYQLDQRVRTLYGLSVGQYITRARIELACHLLKRSSGAISQIALDCGYGDQTAFTRQFRRSVGLTPRAYREVSQRP